MRLHRLIENFLVFSQLELMASEAKKIETLNATAPVAVNPIISEVAQALAVRHKRPGELLLELEEANIFVPAENLKKIVEELVDNAFKFSEKGTKVSVITKVANQTFHLTIRNQGRGMAAEQIARIGPHMQFDRKTFEQQGAGLGLVISKRMTELLGGQFQISSVPGAETVVQVGFGMPGV